MDGPVAGSVTGTELHVNSDASKVGYLYGLVLLKMSWMDLFELKMAQTQLPSLLPVF